MSTLTDQLQKYDGKQILILGWGREGQSTYQLLSTCCPTANITVSDQDETALSEWQKNNHSLQVSTYLQGLNSYQVIFKTAGIFGGIPELSNFLQSGGVMTTQLNEFLLAYKDQVIGVTGTKGKSTTSSLIATLSVASSKHTLLAGNIGTPVFDVGEQVLPESQIILEMSSYQLDSVTSSPHTAVFLNFFPEHLNYHQSIGNYLAAKEKITGFQSQDDILIYNQDSPEVSEVATLSKAQLIPFSYTHNLPYPQNIETVLTELEQVQLPETIKKWNVLPALLASQSFGLSVEQIIAALHTFKPLPHRLETVSSAGEITWIDDTLATIPEATIAALEALPRVDVLLLGGYDRGISYQKIIDVCVTKRIPAIGFFKPSGQTMYDLLRQNYPEAVWPKMKVVESMDEAVQFSLDHSSKGAVVLLSPSSPSFGQFKNYEDKSAQFRIAINKLTAQTSS